MAVNLDRMLDCLNQFDFHRLFVEELGWSQPSHRQATSLTIKDTSFHHIQIAQLSGVAVFEITSANGSVPDAKTRAAIHREIARHHHENLLVFVDEKRSQSIWYWVKRHNGKTFPRDHHFFRGQPGDLFLSKLNSMVFDIGDFDDEGRVSIIEVTGRLKEALDVERVTKKFYSEFQELHLAFLELIRGIGDERDRRWYASVLLNRLMFIYFLQRKFFLNRGDGRYLQNKLAESQAKGSDLYYANFLKVLFFEGFAKPETKRDPEVNALLGKIRYLNGGLFLLHPIEQRWPDISVPDQAFKNLYALFERYSWNLNDTPCGEDNEINPDVLGYIFEKYINQKAFGAFYTRPEITEYLCERTIHRLILDGVNTPGIPGILPPCRFDTIGELLIDLDAPLCRKLLHEVLPNLRLLDPACGSAAFLVAAMKTLINIYAAIIGRIEFLADLNLRQWLEDVKKKHPSVGYFIKKTIITDNLFGVDIMEEAIEIAKLRLFLALVASANSEDDLEPLPNIDFNILHGNSLIGLMHVDDKEFENRSANLFRKSYREILTEKNRLIGNYRHASTYAEDLRTLRDTIDANKKEAAASLNDILLGEFSHLGIKYEQATWDDKKNGEGKPLKRHLKIADIEDLKPFHWGFEFDEIINKHGGFDAIITNPPWEVFEPSAKEFFQEYSDVVTKNKMSLRTFEKERDRLLKDMKIRTSWLEYLSRFPHLSRYFKAAPQYANQLAVIEGKTAASKTNLYKLFVEQAFRLLRKGGQCGMVIPDGIYNARGTTQLRRMLFDKTKITGLFCIENRNEVFENVHRSFKIVVLTFEKGGVSLEFPAAFMRTDIANLDHFPDEGAIVLNVDLIRELSPDQLSVIEFKNERDVEIMRKFLKHPRLNLPIKESWNVSLAQELNMTSDNSLFRKALSTGALPLVQGAMIHQFNAAFAEPKFWIDEKAGRKAILGRSLDDGQLLSYQTYRFVHRRIARSTDERAAIACIVPPGRFCADTAQTTRETIPMPSLLFLTSVFNSFVVDWELRLRITTHVDMHFVYSMRIPRLNKKDAAFWPIVNRAARLVCTAPEFDDLAKAIFGAKETAASVCATDPAEREKLRAELDGMIAHLYNLTEEEFAYILTTFPLVPAPVKTAALNAYRNIEKGLIL